MPKEIAPFDFYECVSLLVPTGKKAINLREFLFILKDIDENVIFHHLYQSYMQYKTEAWDFTNDFANWAAHGLEDMALAEKLANVDPYDYPDLEEVRTALIEIIEEHLWQHQQIPWARPENEFFFSDARTIVLDTGYVANNLMEFREGLTQVGPSSIYYHFFEARKRLGRPDVDDFSFWMDENMNHPNLVKAIRNIDPYFLSLEEVRERILALVDAELKLRPEKE